MGTPINRPLLSRFGSACRVPCLGVPLPASHVPRPVSRAPRPASRVLRPAASAVKHIYPIRSLKFFAVSAAASEPKDSSKVCCRQDSRFKK